MIFPARSTLFDAEGASSEVEKGKKHYQGLPEDVGPDSENNIFSSRDTVQQVGVITRRVSRLQTLLG
jgi:hypothetical protein